MYERVKGHKISRCIDGPSYFDHSAFDITYNVITWLIVFGVVQETVAGGYKDMSSIFADQ